MLCTSEIVLKNVLTELHETRSDQLEDDTVVEIHCL